jgi:hypothetical protein
MSEQSIIRKLASQSRRPVEGLDAEGNMKIIAEDRESLCGDSWVGRRPILTSRSAVSELHIRLYAC